MSATLYHYRVAHELRDQLIASLPYDEVIKKALRTYEVDHIRFSIGDQVQFIFCAGGTFLSTPLEVSSPHLTRCQESELPQREECFA